MYAETPPPPALAGILVCRWTRRAPAAGGFAHVLPDGCIDLVARGDGRLFVAGPDTGPVPTALPGGSRFTGLRFRTGAAAGVLGLPARELRDSRPSAAELWDAPGAELEARVGQAGSDAARLTLLEAWVERRLGVSPPPDPLVAAAVARLRADLSAPVGPLARWTGLGERQLRRRFHAAVGYGPKTLARVLRLQRLLALAETEAGAGTDLARLALDAGYADQAHMTAECGRLAGHPPSVLLRDRFVKDERAAAA